MEVLDPIGAEIARDDKAQRIAIEPGQLLTIHLVSEQGFAVQRQVDIESFDEVRNLRQHRRIESVEGDLARAFGNAGILQNIFEAHAPPAGVAHRSMSHLAARHPRLKKSTAVA